MRIRAMLPEHYLVKESQDSIKLGTGLIATMTALVLGLVTASTKSSFDDVGSAVTQSASQLLTLDRLLARYGRETDGIRHDLQRLARARVADVWQQPLQHGSADATSSPTPFQAEQLSEAVRNLTPHSDSQRALQTRAIDQAEALLQSRWVSVIST